MEWIISSFVTTSYWSTFEPKRALANHYYQRFQCPFVAIIFPHPITISLAIYRVGYRVAICVTLMLALMPKLAWYPLKQPL